VLSIPHGAWFLLAVGLDYGTVLHERSGIDNGLGRKLTELDIILIL